MKNMAKLFGIIALVAAIGLVGTACPTSTGGPSSPKVISIGVIQGVTVPASGATPVTGITATAEYTGTVTWAPTVTGTFASKTVYTATITLSPLQGFILTGLAADFFTVAGTSSPAVFDVELGTVTAVFPATIATVEDCDHFFSGWTVVTPATPDADGEETRTCMICGTVQRRTLPATGNPDCQHVYRPWTVVKEATCTEDGERERTCTNCTRKETEPVPAIGHVWGVWIRTIAPTEFEDGEETRVCTRCMRAETRLVPANGKSDCDHVYSAWIVTIAPSPSIDGERTRTCNICKHVMVNSVAATGNPNCAHPGYGAWVSVREATCSQIGEQERTCTQCPKKEIDLIPLKPHTYGSWERIKEPSWDKDGEDIRSCTVCNHSEKRTVGATGDTSCAHEYGNPRIIRAATCLLEGEQETVCTKCPKKNITIIAASGHSLGAWTQTSAPGCVSTGTERRDCDNCDYFETRTVNMTGHTLAALTQTTDPTCSTKGEKTQLCNICMAIVNKEEVAIVPTAHVYSTWRPSAVTPPTCMNAGTEERICAYCDNIDSRAAPLNPNAHGWGAWQVVVPVTCMAEGSDSRKCKHNDSHVAHRVIPIDDDAHIDGPMVTVPPTATATGYKETICTLCDSTTYYETVYPIPITNITITGVTAPKAGVTATTTSSESSPLYNVSSLTWNGSPASFANLTTYTATITITLVNASNIYTFYDLEDNNGFAGLTSNITNITVNGNPATLVPITIIDPPYSSATSVRVTYTFPQTGVYMGNIVVIGADDAPVIDDITLSISGSSYDTSKTFQISDLAYTDIKWSVTGIQDSIVELYVNGPEKSFSFNTANAPYFNRVGIYKVVVEAKKNGEHPYTRTVTITVVD